jgi:hypothetical protein
VTRLFLPAGSAVGSSCLTSRGTNFSCRYVPLFRLTVRVEGPGIAGPSFVYDRSAQTSIMRPLPETGTRLVVSVGLLM